MIAVTGSTGHLGRLVIEQLLEKVPAGQVVALARNLDKAKELSARGVAVRKADYDVPSTLAAALSGVDQLLLISSSELGKRDTQHASVLAAAQAQSEKPRQGAAAPSKKQAGSAKKKPVKAEKKPAGRRG